jgi:peptidyl-tRNA hydrolase
MVDPTMYLFLNRGLGMSPGKLAAQAAHAAVEAYRLSPEDSNLMRLWRKGLRYKKIVLLGRDTDHMRSIMDYLDARWFPHATVIDEGLTEIDPHSFTAIGCALVDKNEPHTAATFSSFSLYKEEPRGQRKWLLTNR